MQTVSHVLLFLHLLPMTEEKICTPLADAHTGCPRLPPSRLLGWQVLCSLTGSNGQGATGQTDSPRDQLCNWGPVSQVH